MLRFGTQCVVAILLALSAALPLKAETFSITSPDGKMELSVSDQDGHASYAVSHNGAEAISPSRLGLLFRDHHGFERDLVITDTATSSHDATWEQPWGERRLVRDQHNELAVTFTAQSGPARQMIVRFRVFDSGVGFRYELPEQAALTGPIATRHVPKARAFGKASVTLVKTN